MLTVSTARILKLAIKTDTGAGSVSVPLTPKMDGISPRSYVWMSNAFAGVP